MNLDNITDIDELRKLREEIDNKIQNLKKQEQDNNVELVAEQFVGKYIKQYEYKNYVDHYVKNMNKYTIYHITSIQNILYDKCLMCAANVIEICYDKDEIETLDKSIFDDASIDIFTYTDNNCRIDLLQEYEEISNSQVVELIEQAKKDVMNITDEWLNTVQKSKENICSKN